MLQFLERLILDHDMIKSHILISNDIEAEVENLKSLLKPNRVVEFIEEKFLIEHAKAVVAESYISESKTKYIILGALEFNTVSQNSLLKVLEEPPKNIIFVLITISKNSILPTILSRVQVKYNRTKN